LRELERPGAEKSAIAVVWSRSRTVTLRGELDAETVLEAERAVRAAERTCDDLVLDLSDLTFLDSAGLNLIFDTAHRVRDRGGRVTVRATHRLVRRVLRMMFVDELVDVEPALTAADDRDGPTVLPL